MDSKVPRWEQVKELLDQALDLPPQEREAFLRDLSQDDSELHREVLDLLSSAEPATDPLEIPAADLISGDPDLEELRGLEGMQIGAYRLIAPLGAGGMGVVYRAERASEVGGGVVALKLIRRGMASATVARRFRAEREILARLTHPHIALFMDGGVTEDGRPFFVMECVEGEPITTYAARKGLGLEARVRLFLQVLEAIDFAHRNLVVHRDVKPSNILVREDGTAKLVDFGVAKVLGDSEAPGVTLTRLGGRVLTPSYSSPEQVRGDVVTTAADVYSLGVVLYELLARQRPFDLDTVPLAEVHRVVNFEEPTRPSDAVRNREPAQQLDTRRLSRRLSGDLDTIVMKALRKEPDRRYSSARELHDDLCRWLDGEPVLARRGTWNYRAGKFLRRHRTAAISGVVLLGALGIGGGVAWRQSVEASRQAAIAEQRVEDVRALVNTLLFEVHDEVADLQGSTAARQLILEKAYERLEDTQEDLPEDPALLMSLAEAYRRLGDVQGRPMGPNLGDLQAARRSFDRGIALGERAMELAPSDLVASRSLGLLHERYASVLVFSGNVDEGVEHSREALRIYQRISDAFPDSTRHQFTTAIGTINLADYTGHPSFPNLGDPAQAERLYADVQQRLGTGVLGQDEGWGVRRYRALVQERLARIHRLRGDFQAARVAYAASTEARVRLAEENPNDDAIDRDVGVGYQNLCVVDYQLGEFDRAEAACGRALARYQERFRVDSLNAQTVMDLAEVHRSYEELYRLSGDTARALEHLDQVLLWSERRLQRDSTALPPRLVMVDALLTRGLLHLRTGRPPPPAEGLESLMASLSEEGHLTAYDAARADTLRRGLPRR